MKTSEALILKKILKQLEEINENTKKKYRDVKYTTGTNPFNLEAVYNLYPRKEGKTQGLKRLAGVIKSKKDYDLLIQATLNYAEKCLREKTDKKFIKTFGTFASCWRDYLETPREMSLASRFEKAEQTAGFLV